MKKLYILVIISVIFLAGCEVFPNGVNFDAQDANVKIMVYPTIPLPSESAFLFSTAVTTNIMTYETLVTNSNLTFGILLTNLTTSNLYPFDLTSMGYIISVYDIAYSTNIAILEIEVSEPDFSVNYFTEKQTPSPNVSVNSDLDFLITNVSPGKQYDITVSAGDGIHPVSIGFGLLEIQ